MPDAVSSAGADSQAPLTNEAAPDPKAGGSSGSAASAPGSTGPGKDGAGQSGKPQNLSEKRAARKADLLKTQNEARSATKKGGAPAAHQATGSPPAGASPSSAADHKKDGEKPAESKDEKPAEKPLDALAKAARAKRENQKILDEAKAAGETVKAERAALESDKGLIEWARPLKQLADKGDVKGLAQAVRQVCGPKLQDVWFELTGQVSGGDEEQPRMSPEEMRALAREEAKAELKAEQEAEAERERQEQERKAERWNSAVNAYGKEIAALVTQEKYPHFVARNYIGKDGQGQPRYFVPRDRLERAIREEYAKNRGKGLADPSPEPQDILALLETEDRDHITKTLPASGQAPPSTTAPGRTITPDMKAGALPPQGGDQPESIAQMRERRKQFLREAQRNATR